MFCRSGLFRSMLLSLSLTVGGVSGCAPLKEGATAVSATAVVTITARDGVVDFSRIEIADRTGHVLSMTEWFRVANRPTPTERIFELVGSESPSATPESISIEALKIYQIAIYDSDGRLVGIIDIIEP